MTYHEGASVANAVALAAAIEQIPEWARCITPEDAERDIQNHLFGAMMCHVEPDAFRSMLEAAARFAGKPAEAS